MSKANCLSRFTGAAARTALALGAVVALGAFTAATPARAQGAWCAYYSGTHGGTNCGFYTLQQCREAISGVGGVCSVSPYVSQILRRGARHAAAPCEVHRLDFDLDQRLHCVSVVA